MLYILRGCISLVQIIPQSLSAKVSYAVHFTWLELFIPLLHNNAFSSLKYHIFENIMENGAFAPKEQA